MFHGYVGPYSVASRQSAQGFTRQRAQGIHGRHVANHRVDSDGYVDATVLVFFLFCRPAAVATQQPSVGLQKHGRFALAPFEEFSPSSTSIPINVTDKMLTKKRLSTRLSASSCDHDFCFLALRQERVGKRPALDRARPCWGSRDAGCSDCSGSEGLRRLLDALQ